MSTYTTCRIFFVSLALAALSCAPNYRSGVTGCAGGDCPSGFVCVKALCYLPGDVPSSKDGGPPSEAGVRAAEAGVPSGVTPDSCRDPDPQFCAARGAIPAVCQEERIDCATVTRCPDGIRGCRKGETVDCRYRADYCQSPVKCEDDPSFPISCAAMGEIGPSCFSPGADCGTRAICGQERSARVCLAGQKVDCKYQDNYCLPPQPCTGDSINCPALGEIGPGCWSANLDCNTRTLCGLRDARACRAGQKVDCQYAIDSCVPAEVCGGDLPVSCPPMGDFGPGCWFANTDCSTRTLCEDGYGKACEAGQKVDCQYSIDFCLPPKPCGGDLPVSCPAMGVFGPGCWSMGTDCASRALCGDDVRSCRPGLKVDCKYRADYCVAPGGACAATATRCPPMGDLGPFCADNVPQGLTLDCAGRVVCPDETSSTVCYTGTHVDCSKPRAQRCVANGNPPGGADAGAGAPRG